MRLNESATYVGATPAQVFELTCNEEFRSAVCEKIGAISHDVSVGRGDDGEDTATIRIEREMPADMPDFVKNLIGDTVKVVQTESWGPAGDDGFRTGSIEVQILGQPASMTGTTTLRASGADTELALDGEVTVKVPFIGRKIEPEITKAIASALRTEAAEGVAYLKS